MIPHLFKLIWNKKKQNFLLMAEMFASFIVMFAVFTFLVFSYNNYSKPRGFTDTDVWVINYTKPETINADDSIAMFQDLLKKTMLSMPEIKAVSFTGNNLPFSMSGHNSQTNYGNVKRVETNIYDVDPTYAQLLEAKVVEGKWGTTADANGKLPAAVINAKLKATLFGNENPLGKTIGTDYDRYRVIGVVEDMKDKGDYQAVEHGIYRLIDTGAMRMNSNILVKVRPGTGAAFESKLFKTLSNVIGTSIEIEHLDKKRENKNQLMVVPMVIMIVVAGFLIINVSLGLFGVLWYNINKRKAEIGLRRAVGASGPAVAKQLVGEALVLSTISLLIGTFFAIQFPLLNVFDLPASIYLVALALAIGFIYLLVMICAFYPGQQAAAIYPAVALHEE